MMQVRSSPTIRVIAVDGRYLWLGTTQGLILYDKTLESVVHVYSTYRPVRDIDVRDKIVWVTTPDQIALFRRERYGDRWTTLMGSEIRDFVQGEPPRVKRLKEDLGIEITKFARTFVQTRYALICAEPSVVSDYGDAIYLTAS